METDRRRNVHYVIVKPDGEVLEVYNEATQHRREAQFGSRLQAEEYRDGLWPSATVERVEQG